MYGCKQSDAGRVISKLVTIADAALTVSKFYRIPLDKTITNTFFLVSFRVTNPLSLEILGNKNNFRTI